MSRRLRNPMPDEITRSQRAASEPLDSVWVTANAGSGKTYVLTARVLRLLLSGARPEEILCLTYTKAAAAEMRERVSARLGRWAVASDLELAQELRDLEGAAPSPRALLRARSLFARALETPGGLKIQTIHAFCESVLHRFPREAGVPFDFTVIEDFERDAMLREAREQVIAAGIRGGGEALAVETLFGLLSDFQIETSIIEAVNKQRTLKAVLAQSELAKRNLRRLAGDSGRNIATIERDIVEGSVFPFAEWPLLFAHLPPDPTKTQRLNFTERLYRLRNAQPDAEELLDAFLKDGREPYKDRCTAKITNVALADAVGAEHDRLAGLAQELTAATLIERSEAMLDIVKAISAHYERAKRARSLLDFGDLIERLAALLQDHDRGLWVRYKLDSDISHILLDEGQDTNLPQWEVVWTLIEDFFVGDSAADRPRTLFAVGDQKQSIFSFQGADPELFVNAGRQLSFSAQMVKFEIKPVKLHYSFRTLPGVLAAVDTVFGHDDLAEAVLEDGVIHSTARAESGGTVTLWPPLRELDDDADPENWPTRPPEAMLKSAPRRVAEKIAREIRGWLEAGRPLGPRQRPVVADDVLILVQVRSVLFHEIIRALVREGVPTPGADRLAVTTHIGVLDLMALGDVLLNTAEDLQLAALLRSPLFDVTEDELFAVAQPRPEGATLWSALQRCSIPSVAAACERLSHWRGRLDFERPFNFYADVLYAEGGLKRFRARLGAEIDDVVAEFLDLALAHEQSAQPSLMGFLAELRRREVTIKRELGEAGSGVRVMTVHGAKGLEAPIVILADAATTEARRDRRSVYMVEEPPLFFHASAEWMLAGQTVGHKQDADAAQAAEYWRKLYVAMTRAEDELYVTGYLTKRGRMDGTWYDAIDRALRPEAESVADADGAEAALLYPRERVDAGVASNAVPVVAPRATPPLPQLPKYRLRRIVRPSTAFADADPDTVLDTAAERLAGRRDAEAARQEGVALHALLHHLGRLDATGRAAVAAKALPILLPERPDLHAQLIAKALSILGGESFAFIFGPNSRGEVPVLAQGTRKGQPITLAGRIDRLVVEPGRVLVVDYKSDALAPATPAGISTGYISQLGLYALCAGQLFPDHRIEAGILWTGLESLMILPSAQLREAVASFTIG